VFLLAGGGTGGHFFPALALGRFLKEKGHEVTLVASSRGPERSVRTELPVLHLEARPFSLSPKGFFEFLLSAYRSYRKLEQAVPGAEAVVSFGGYASTAASLYALKKGIPLFLHEQNAVPSRSSRLFRRFARVTFVAFERAKSFFPEAVRVGLPLRKEAKKRYAKKEARRLLGLPEEATVVLVLGGSQGALFLNELTLKLARHLPFTFLLVTGRSHYERFRKAPPSVKALPFLEETGLLYSAADVAVSRAGAGACAELSYHGVPTLFIPYPYAVYDHQYHNAKELELLGGALVLRQQEATPKKVLKALETLLSDRSLYSERIKRFCDGKADERMYAYLTAEGGL